MRSGWIVGLEEGRGGGIRWEEDGRGWNRRFQWGAGKVSPDRPQPTNPSEFFPPPPLLHSSPYSASLVADQQPNILNSLKKVNKKTSNTGLSSFTTRISISLLSISQPSPSSLLLTYVQYPPRTDLYSSIHPSTHQPPHLNLITPPSPPRHQASSQKYKIPPLTPVNSRFP